MVRGELFLTVFDRIGGHATAENFACTIKSGLHRFIIKA
jgi:hypothetical protein